MKKLLQEFKEFALKGSVVDLAVGMMIGSAFGKIVSSLVNDVLTPIISGIFQIPDFTNLSVTLVNKEGVDPVVLAYGSFIQNVIDFLIVAACIFALVKAINKLKDALAPKEVEEEKPAEPEKSPELKALEEIASILRESK